MRGVILKSPAALEQLALTDLPDPGLPGPGEVRVRIHAGSLNYHDLAVVTGMLPTLPGHGASSGDEGCLAHSTWMYVLAVSVCCGDIAVLALRRLRG